jgi:site-specific recombinase XerD
MRLSDLFETMYRPIRLPFAAPNTLRLYRHSVVAYSRHLRRDATLEDLDDVAVGTYLSSLAGGGLSPYTVAKERSQLLAIWNFAARRRLVDRWPEVAAPTLPQRIPVAWTIGELRQLLDACRKERGEYCGVPAGPWWTALHHVAWDTGERISALLALTWANLRGEWLRIAAETRKGKRADKMFRLAAVTVVGLDLIRRPRRDLIFPWPHNGTYLWHVYGLILSAAHLPRDQKHKFHCLRRSVASHLKAAGGDPTSALGHADPRTTLKYLDPRIVSPGQPCDLLPAISKPPALEDTLRV